MTEYGVIVGAERAALALATGADYVEPTIVGNIVVAGEAGWVRNPEYRGRDRASSFAILFPADVKLSDPGYPRENVSAYLEAVMPTIADTALPGAKIVFGSGAARTIPDHVGVENGRARFAEVVVETRDVASRHDLRIILEPLNRRESNLLNSIEETVAFLDDFEIDRVPVVADLYHVMLESEPLSVIGKAGSRIGHAHIADTGRTPPGAGDWPLKEFIETLHASGYDGSISIECTFHDFETELGSALAHLRAIA